MTKKKMGEEAAEKYLEFMDSFIKSVGKASMKSIKNQFYSDLIIPLDKHINADNTTVHIFYALKMGEKYCARYLEHFAAPDIREQNYGHEELLFFEPEKWFEEFEACVNDNRVPLKTALKRENVSAASKTRKGSEGLLAQGEET